MNIFQKFIDWKRRPTNKYVKYNPGVERYIVSTIELDYTLDGIDLKGIQNDPRLTQYRTVDRYIKRLYKEHNDTLKGKYMRRNIRNFKNTMWYTSFSIKFYFINLKDRLLLKRKSEKDD